MDYDTVYSALFGTPTYSVHPATEVRYQYALRFTKRHCGDPGSLVDLGSGRGVFLRLFAEHFPNTPMLSVDLRDFHGLDLPHLAFQAADLSRPADRRALRDRRFGLLTCLDCLEHLEVDFIDDVVEMCGSMTEHAAMTIANHSDVIGGVELHQIQRGPSYWGPLLERHFEVLDYREAYGGSLMCFGLRSRKART